MKSIKISILLLPLLLAIAPPAKGQLKAVLTPTKLPWAMVAAALAYDGDDVIYLLGGPRHNEILRYSISSGVLEVAGTNPAFGSFGIAETDRNGNPIHLSSSDFAGEGKDVVRFNRLQNTTELIATHTHSKFTAASVKINADTVLIIGGAGKWNGLLTFNTATCESTVRANLPSEIDEPTAVKVGNAAFVFSSFYTVLKIDLYSFSSEVIAPEFPFLSYRPRAVYDGQNIYIIGGSNDRDGIPSEGIIQFNPDSYEWKFVPVENFPVSGPTHFIIAPESVYVEKMNRIYMFGGLINTTLSDDIWYIELNHEDPTTSESTTTTNEPPTTKHTTSEPTTTKPTTSDLPDSTTLSSSASRPFCSILLTEFALFFMLIAKIINYYIF